MKKETKDFVRIFAVVFIAMVVLPLAYRLWFLSRPPEPGSNPSPAQLFEKAMDARAARLLKKPVGTWTDAEAKLEPEIYAWLKEQGNEILPWEWTEEARRKAPKGYAKCWRRIWRERKFHCERQLAEQQKEIKRLEREFQILTAIHTHRTNQIARLCSIAATNTFPCQVTIERLEKGRFWGWNKKVEVVDCKDAVSIMADTNSIYGKETVTAGDEFMAIRALEDSVSSLKEKSVLYEKLLEICYQNNLQIESNSSQTEAFEESLVKNLKGAKR